MMHTKLGFFRKLNVTLLAALTTGLAIETSPGQGLTITPAVGYDVTWDGNDGDFYDNASIPAPAPDNAALAGTAFAENDPGAFPVPHVVTNLNDGFYGNSSSHINGLGGRFMGIALPNEVQLVAVAWGRDNGTPAGATPPGGQADCCGGQLIDRNLGTYTLQISTVVNPNASTPDADWTTIATLSYSGGGDGAPGGTFDSYLRHQYEVATEGGDPIAATGVRIIAPDTGVAIDEIELYIEGEVPIPRLFPVEAGGVVEANNLAASGTAFAKDVLAGRSVGSLNDETFGDASAWVGATSDSFAGIGLDAATEVRSIAFGRDNTGGETDRALGTYTLQFTDVASPDETTPDGDWTTIAKITYEAGEPVAPHLRHRFNFGAVTATGIRLLTPDGAAIDELEVYENLYVPPPPPALTITPAAGFTATWDGNDGDFYDNASEPALVPENLALATNGAIPFASNPTSLHFPPHDFAKINDGFYGNSHSHINGGGPNPGHMGIALPGPTALTAIAWGRDNGTPAGATPPGGLGDCCGGQLQDRSIGTYTVQFTTVASPDASTPDADWTTIAEFRYLGDADKTDDAPGGLFTEWLRHQYEIGTADGGPIVATGVRIIVPDPGICIDEIEIYGVTAPPVGPTLRISHDVSAGELTIRWNSQDGRLYNVRSEADLSAGDPITWPIFDGNQDIAATPPENLVTFPFPVETERFFVVEDFPAPPAVVFSDDFENGQGGWTVGSDRLPGTDWQLGTPANVGPGAAHSPVNAFGTNIDANYADDAEIWLRSPAIDLTTAAGATLSFWQFRDIEATFDFGAVRILDAADDSLIEEIVSDIDDTSADWEEITESLPAAALGKSIVIEFRFTADDFTSVSQAGWYIDDVTVTVP